MAKLIPMERCGLILDAIYENTNKPKDTQRSVKSLAKMCEVSPTIVLKVREILISLKILIKEGERRSQVVYWHPSKARPSSAMLTLLYKEYIKDAKCKVKLAKPKGRISLESALHTLINLGWTGVISKTHYNGYRIFTESIDLSKIPEEV